MLFAKPGIHVAIRPAVLAVHPPGLQAIVQ